MEIMKKIWTISFGVSNESFPVINFYIGKEDS